MPVFWNQTGEHPSALLQVAHRHGAAAVALCLPISSDGRIGILKVGREEEIVFPEFPIADLSDDMRDPVAEVFISEFLEVAARPVVGFLGYYGRIKPDSSSRVINGIILPFTLDFPIPCHRISPRPEYKRPDNRFGWPAFDKAASLVHRNYEQRQRASEKTLNALRCVHRFVEVMTEMDPD